MRPQEAARKMAREEAIKAGVSPKLIEASDAFDVEFKALLHKHLPLLIEADGKPLPTEAHKRLALDIKYLGGGIFTAVVHCMFDVIRERLPEGSRAAESTLPMAILLDRIRDNTGELAHIVARAALAKILEKQGGPSKFTDLATDLLNGANVTPGELARAAADARKAAADPAMSPDEIEAALKQEPAPVDPDKPNPWSGARDGLS